MTAETAAGGSIRCPRAHLGLRFIFWAEICTAVSAVMPVIVYPVMTIAMNRGDTSLLTTLEYLTMIQVEMNVSNVFLAVSLALNMAGMILAARDEKGFLNGVWVVLINAACLLIKNIELSDVLAFIYLIGWANVISRTCEVLRSFMVMTGIMNMADRLRNDIAADNAEKTRMTLFFLFAVTVVGELLISGENSTSGIGIWISYGMTGVEIVTLIVYMRGIVRGRRMLQE